MDEVKDAVRLREIVRRARCERRSVGFVPTMGYLHSGHVYLVEHARAENDLVVMSIFVNPTQFGPHEDFDRYPRDLAHDRVLAAERGVDVLFVPDNATIYPHGAEAQTIWIDPGPLADHLCGASRPGHFRGVTTVVSKLLNMVLPDRLYLGQKDAQQAVILTRMVRDLAFPTDVRIVQTVREADGLAMSSRNVYLSPREREQAVALWRSLEMAKTKIVSGERTVHRIESAMRDLIRGTAPLGRIDYLTIADLVTLEPLDETLQGDALVALAVYFRSTRLIDNTIVRFIDGEPQFT